jgi:hypothetical protein
MDSVSEPGAQPVPEAPARAATVSSGTSEPILSARSKARARLHAAIPHRYNPWLHLAGTTGVGLVALMVGLSLLRDVHARDLLVVPFTFVLANLVEWRAHKDLLHHRRPPAEVLYDRHTPEHHMVFGYDDMAVRDWRELKLVLIPAFGVAAIVATMAPIALGFAWLLGRNVGALFLVTSALYVVGYELSHLSYHLPEQSFVGRLALVRVLREHHRRHHHPRLMQKWNFNVTIPLGDLVHGTIVSRAELDATLACDARDAPRRP